MKNIRNTKGFTLIELLVVITIIGILATGATTVYTSQIQKARDTTRINDVKALQSAIEQVYQDRGIYPRGDRFLVDTDGVAVSTYMPKIPRDPKDGQSCSNGGMSGVNNACVYRYQTGQDDNGIEQGIYVLTTRFESLGKIQSDGKKDGGPLDYRWEVGNGIIGNNSLSVPVNYDTSGGCNETTVTKTTTGILNQNCGTTGITKNRIITIHGS